MGSYTLVFQWLYSFCPHWSVGSFQLGFLFVGWGQCTYTIKIQNFIRDNILYINNDCLKLKSQFLYTEVLAQYHVAYENMYFIYFLYSFLKLFIGLMILCVFLLLFAFLLVFPEGNKKIWYYWNIHWKHCYVNGMAVAIE